jgi:hypothetical protein
VDGHGEHVVGGCGEFPFVCVGKPSRRLPQGDPGDVGDLVVCTACEHMTVPPVAVPEPRDDREPTIA